MRTEGNPAWGKLYLCGTPIGNLEDISLRALRILKEVDLIAAEDTRQTKKLLNYYNVITPLTSYHEHNKKTKGPWLIEQLKQGKNIALVSDAGMPGISDPGQDLVMAAAAQDIRVIPVPGPSAAVTALVCSGLPSDRFVFEGFVPRLKKERAAFFQRLAGEPRTVVFYEAPHRLVKTLEEILALAGDRRITVGRELTKLNEEFVRGSVSEVLQHFRQKEPRGEFTLVLEGRQELPAPKVQHGPEEVYRTVTDLTREGLDRKEAMKRAAKALGISKKEVYEAVLAAEKKK